MLSANMPVHNESQEIGSDAVKAFESNIPRSWSSKPLEGDDDIGFDKLIQYFPDNKFEYLFLVQVKGSRSSKLINNGNLYSLAKIKVSTLNGFLRAEAPVLLAFADLISDKDPRDCKVYYLWLPEVLEKLRDSHENLDHLGKPDSMPTLHIPTVNVLHRELDILPYLEQRYKERIAVSNFKKAIESKKTDVMTVVTSLTQRISTSPESYLKAILAENDDPWVNTPADSFAGQLKSVAQRLARNEYSSAKKELTDIEKNVDGVDNKHEKAEYFYLRAKFFDYEDDFVKSEEFYQKAHNLFSENVKYRFSYYEHRVLRHLFDAKIVEETLCNIKKETNVRFINLRAQLLANLKQFDDALATIAGQNDTDVIVVKVMIYYLSENYEKSTALAQQAFTELRISIRQKFLLKSFEARSYFNQATLGRSSLSIPFSGLPNMDVVAARKSWDAIKECWQLTVELGYPVELKLIYDISAILGCYLNEYNTIYIQMKEVAWQHPHIEFFQKTLLYMGHYIQDNEVVEETLKNLLRTPETIIHEVFLQYCRNEKLKLVELVKENYKQLIDEKPENYQVVLAIAAQCADEMLRTSEAELFLTLLKEQPNSDSLLQLHENFKEKNENVFANEATLENLYTLFKKGNRDNGLLANLFHALSAFDAVGAQKILEVAVAIFATRDVDEDELIHICQAYATLKSWNTLEHVITKGIQRFGRKTRLLGIKAMALDQKGDTPSALTLFESIDFTSKSDDLTIEYYAHLSARCGFTQQAKSSIQSLYAKSKSIKEKARFLRLIYQLEMLIDYKSPMLLDYSWHYGQLCDQSNENEEAAFIHFYIGATQFYADTISEQKQQEFTRRLHAFTQNFPNSQTLRLIHLPNNASSNQIYTLLENITGINQTQRKWQDRIAHLINWGDLSVPYALRQIYTSNASDLLIQWEMTKNSNKMNMMYHLRLTVGNYEVKNAKDVANKTPLLDDVAILVLHDLGLMNSLFQLFDKVAIAKQTIIRFQQLSTHKTISPFFETSSAIVKCLANHITKIQQPGDNGQQKLLLNFTEENLEELKAIVQERGYTFYSDDVITRQYVVGDNYNQHSLCTLDTINAMRQKRVIEDRTAIECLSKLCRWNTSGVKLFFDDILRPLQGKDYAQMDREAISQELFNNELFKSFVDALWDEHKDIKIGLKQLSDFVKYMLIMQSTYKIPDILIATVWEMCLTKAIIADTRNISYQRHFIHSFIVTCGIIEEESDPQLGCCPVNSKLWSIFQGIYIQKFLSRNDKAIDELLKQIAATLVAIESEEKRGYLYNKVAVCFIDNTSEKQKLSNYFVNACAQSVLISQR